jgi:hypothetical protein
MRGLVLNPPQIVRSLVSKRHYVLTHLPHLHMPYGLWVVRHGSTEIGRQLSLPSASDCDSMHTRHQAGLDAQAALRAAAKRVPASGLVERGTPGEYTRITRSAGNRRTRGAA